MTRAELFEILARKFQKNKVAGNKLAEVIYEIKRREAENINKNKNELNYIIRATSLTPTEVENFLEGNITLADLFTKQKI